MYVGCNTNYATCEEKVSVFSFPDEENNSELRLKWERFVNRAGEWTAKDRSVLCEKHFEPHYIKPGKKRNHLKRKLDPIPTIHSEEALKTPSCTYTPVPPRKKPKVRNMQEEQIHDFRKLDEITSSTIR